MSSMSRFAVKDFKLGTCDAFCRPSSSLSARRLQTHLDRRGVLSVPENGRSCAIQRQPWSPIVVESKSRNSEVLCKAATTNLSGDLPGSTPSRMSQHERIIETLTTLFPVWEHLQILNPIPWTGHIGHHPGDLQAICCNLVGNRPFHTWTGIPRAWDWD